MLVAVGPGPWKHLASLPSTTAAALPRHRLACSLERIQAQLSNFHSPQRILVCIAQLLEDGSRGLGARWFAVHHVEKAQLVLNNVCDSLCVGGGARAATPDCIGHAGQLVGHTVGNVGASGGTGVSTWRERVGEVSLGYC